MVQGGQHQLQKSPDVLMENANSDPLAGSVERERLAQGRDVPGFGNSGCISRKHTLYTRLSNPSICRSAEIYPVLVRSM